MRRSLARTLLPVLVSVGLAFLVAGCSTTEPEPMPDPPDPADERIDGILINHVASAPLVEAHFQAWSAKSVAAYDALLEKPVPGRGATGFRFYVRADDATQLPWVQNGYWDYDVEMQIVRNMTDPDFSGNELPVDTIEATYSVYGHEDLGNGVGRTTVQFIFMVLVGPDDGWIADTKLELVSGPDDDGFLRIREIREYELIRLQLSDSASAEEATFGGIKSLYR